MEALKEELKNKIITTLNLEDIAIEGTLLITILCLETV
jgi:hypothetical protein